jgi:hypothetical protein
MEWLIIIAIVMVVIGVGIGAIDRLFNSGNSKATPNSHQEKDSVIDNSSKVEAVRQQLKRDIPAVTNKPVSPTYKPSVPSDNLGLSDDKPVVSVPQKANQTQEQKIINITIEPDEIKSQAASEVVDVPKGVTIKVKRIRTVEHTINIEWSATIAGKGEVGIKQLVSASIQGEIQRVKGYVSQQSESMEYEITLDGDKHTQYKLVWMDVWLKGTAEIQDGNGNSQQPFQFRDRAELKVVPTYT